MAGRTQAGCDPWQSDTRRSAWFSAGKFRVQIDAEADTKFLPHPPRTFRFRFVFCSVHFFFLCKYEFMIRLEMILSLCDKWVLSSAYGGELSTKTHV